MENNLRKDVKEILGRSISDDYLNRILEKIIDEVVEDVEISSAYEEGFYSEDDIKLSIGRILIDRLELEY